ncbi:MAG: HD-GYP domain-containing protein, partial [Actinomycetota bacterium]|nr:HD-GYP domain-containing protein [Actinomycetota bacterium]
MRDLRGPKEQRWQSRPLISALLRAAIFLAPVVASVGAAVTMASILPAPDSPATTALWWLTVFGVATAVLVVVERLARRLLPLAMLLRLAMLFPAKAPSRLALARRIGTTRQLRERLSEARERGVQDEASQAAETILTLVGALQAHDRRTRGHAERVRIFTDLLALELKLSQDDRDRLRWGALLHDIGKLTVSAEVLNKPGSLSQDEWVVMRGHPDAGARFCAPLLPWLGEWAAAIDQHHEHYDGRGYPRGLAGDEIALAARIVAVADAFEVMTSPRTYRRPVSAAAARQELARNAGSQFDPAVVRAFLNLAIGRLRLVMGPVAWLAQLPFVRSVATSSPVPATTAAAGLT